MSCLQEQNAPNKITITISRTITKIVQPSFHLCAPSQVDRLKNKRIYKLNKILSSPPAAQQGEIFRHAAVAK